MRNLEVALIVLLLLCLFSTGLSADSPAGETKSARKSHHHFHGHGHSHSDAEDQSEGPNESSAAVSTGRWPLILLGLYCGLIVGASLLGGWLPQLIHLTHTRMQLSISLIGGLMLGISVLHLWPHAIAELGDHGPDVAATGMMAGLIVMFLLMRMFHFHHHGAPEDDCGHDHSHEGPEHSVPSPAAGSPSEPHHAAGRLSWVGVFLGMALHTLIDGLALGASVQADALHEDTGLLGVGTFLAVVLHKPLDSVTIISLMAASGWSLRSRALVNLAFSLACPAGAILFVLGVREFTGQQALIVGFALAVSAGVFMCIALSDLLPEMEFHSHNRVRLSIALLAGIAIAWGIRFIEPAHAYSQHRETHRHLHSH